MKRISGFFGPNRWLSNFWPCEIEFEGEMYKSVEEAYQAAKTTDENIRFLIRHSKTPAEAKRRGKELKLRPGWNEMRVEIMAQLLHKKFIKNGQPTELGKRLLATGDAELVESNYWGDVFFGVCKGVGQNVLGKLLMLTREILLWGMDDGSHEG